MFLFLLRLDEMTSVKILSHPGHNYPKTVKVKGYWTWLKILEDISSDLMVGKLSYLTSVGSSIPLNCWPLTFDFGYIRRPEWCWLSGVDGLMHWSMFFKKKQLYNNLKKSKHHVKECWQCVLLNHGSCVCWLYIVL